MIMITLRSANQNTAVQGLIGSTNAYIGLSDTATEVDDDDDGDGYDDDDDNFQFADDDDCYDDGDGDDERLHRTLRHHHYQDH